MYDNINRLSETDIHQVLGEHLGASYVDYRSEWSAVSPTNIPSFPLHIDFELKDMCNQSCVMCPRNEEAHPDINYQLDARTVLSEDSFKKVIDEGAINGLRSVNLGGFAEPLVQTRCLDMVDYARSQGIIDTRIITNGLLMHRHMDAIFDSGLVNLFVSLDAYNPETYQAQRGPGFAKIKNSLLELLEEKKRRGSVLPIVRVSLVDMKSNHDEIEDFVKYWGPKVDFIDIQVFDDFNVDITQPFDKGQTKKWDCRSPFARLSVMSNGEVLPCCNFFGKNIPVGNIEENTISEIWMSKTVRSVRDGIMNDQLDNCSICQRIG